MKFPGHWFYNLIFKFKDWKYKRKYGITMGEAMKEYGKNIKLNYESEK